MSKKLFMYLFVFTLLILVFQYVNSKKILDAKDERIEELRQEIAENEAEIELGARSVDSILQKQEDLQYFSFLESDKAMSYFERRGIEAREISKAIQDAIIDKNLSENGNPLVPFEGDNGRMLINKIKILNHKWIIAEFTDGTAWGELFITYRLDENNDLIFEVEKAFLYPQN